MMRLSTLLAAGLLAAACTETVTLAPAGAFSTGHYVMELERDWSRIPDGLAPSVSVDQLTVDGPQLNQVYLIDGLKDGAAIIERDEDEDPAPVFRTAMSELDVVEFLTDTLSEMGLQDVAVSDVRPADFAGSPGVRFDFAAARENGLALAGSAAAATSGETLNGLIFVAPAEHYYNAYRGDVETMFDSARGISADQS